MKLRLLPIDDIPAVDVPSSIAPEQWFTWLVALQALLANAPALQRKATFYFNRYAAGDRSPALYLALYDPTGSFGKFFEPILP